MVIWLLKQINLHCEQLVLPAGTSCAKFAGSIALMPTPLNYITVLDV